MLSIRQDIKNRFRAMQHQRQLPFHIISLIALSCLGLLCGEIFWRILLLPWVVTTDAISQLDSGQPIVSSCLIFPDTQNTFKPPTPYRRRHHDDNPENVGKEPGTAWSWPLVEQEMERLSEQGQEQEQRFLYVVTPTVRGPSQIPDLIRTAQALYPMRKRIRWLIFEDSGKKGATSTYPKHLPFLSRVLKDFTGTDDSMDVHINWSRQRQKGEYVFEAPKGVEGRRDGLAWVRKRTRSGDKSVIFFADDDNTYDSDLFRQLLTVMSKRISAWPVGLVTDGTRLSSPVVNSSGVTFDIHDGWKVNRKFPMDFGGFALSTKFILEKSNATIPYSAGYEETTFLKRLGINLQEIQPLGNGATEVLSYHSRTNYIRFKKHKTTTMDFVNWENADNLIDINTNIADLYKKYEFTRSVGRG